MPKVIPLQTSFAAGEISPKMLGRVDTEAYSQGAQTLQNFLPNPRGPAERRGGERDLHYFSTGSWPHARLEELQISENLFFSVLFANYNLFINAPDTAAASGTIADDPYIGSDTYWGSSTGGVSDVYYKGYGKCILSTRYTNAHARISQDVGSPTGTFVVKVATKGDNPYRVRIGHSGSITNYYDAVHHEEVARIVLPFTGNPNTIIAVENHYSEFEDQEAVHDVEVYSIFCYQYGGANADVTRIPSPWSDQWVNDLHVIRAPSHDEMYILHNKTAPRKLTYNASTNTWTLSTVTWTSQPAAWTAVSWNYPTTGCFFQGRLWLGGCPNNPETFWGSKSGSYEDFTTGAGAADALEFTMADKGEIKWMAGLKNLLIGTENGEHIVTSEGGVIYSGDIQVQRQSSYGSNHLAGVQVGDQMFYVSPDGTKVRAMQYEWTANNWLSRDLSFFSDHITEGVISDIAWAQNPNNLFYAVLRNGDIALMTYERGNNIYGWSKITTTGRYLSICSGVRDGVSIIHAAVNRTRTFTGIDVRKLNSKFHMDMYEEQYHEGGSGTTITGLDSFNQEEVQVLVDGAVHPNRTVVASTITLDWGGQHIVVGLPYESKLKTVPVNSMGSKIGASVPHLKHFNKIYIQILESAYPLVNGERPSERSFNSAMDMTEPDATETLQALNDGWDYNATMEIIQDLPRACTILSVSGELNQEIP